MHPYEFAELNWLTSVRHFMGAGVIEFYSFEAPELKDPCGRCVRLGDQQASAGMGRG